jgi:hypothetical protein
MMNNKILEIVDHDNILLALFGGMLIDGIFLVVLLIYVWSIFI